MDNIANLRQSVTDFAKTLDLPPFVYKLNDLLNQRAWEQAAEEEKIATQKIADMWAIVQAVATEPSTYLDDQFGWWECPFCNGGDNRAESDHIKHEPGCIVMKARAMTKDARAGESHGE